MRLRRKVPPAAALLLPEGSPRFFLVDIRFLRRLREVRWRYVAKGNRARGFFGKGQTRQYLHRYVLSLGRKFYPEVTFANGDWSDCRLVNLRPYRRDEDGAGRRLFKNSSSKRKGVSFHKLKKKWIAMIRARGKLRYLGYFKTADLAAKAYASAWKLAHPTSIPKWEIGR